MAEFRANADGCQLGPDHIISPGNKAPEIDVRIRNAKKTYRTGSVWCLLTVVLLLLSSSAEVRAIEILPLDQVQVGMKAEALTVLTGTEPEPIEIEILGVLDDFIGPELPLILGRFVGEKGTWEGVAAGMSGSPVHIDGKLIGALSYSIGSFTKEPICGITPIESMLAVGKYPRRPLPWFGDAGAAGDLRRAPLALGIRGLTKSQLSSFSDLFEGLGEVGSIEVVPTPSALASLDGEDLAPGKPITALLMWGAMEIGATGTVTWREGDRLLAFGHPFLGSGRSAMPIAPSEIVWTVASEASSFKLSRFGKSAGTLTQDRATGIEGQVGEAPAGLPIHVSVNSPGAPPVDQEYFIIKDPFYLSSLANFALRSALTGTLVNELDQAMLMSGAVTLEDGTRVPLHAAGAGGASGPPERQLGAALTRQLAALVQAPLELPAVSRVDLEVRTIPRGGALKLVRAMPDRLVARAGERVTVSVEYLGERGRRRRVVLPIGIPEDLLPGEYTIFAGSSRAVAKEFGAVHEARRRSARSAGAYLKALGEVPSETSLELVLALKAEGIVSEGKEFPALPGTAHILLRSRPGGNELFRSRWLKLAEAKLELGRPLTGQLKALITISESTP